MSDVVGVVGAGRMGLPIIGHLVRAGFRTLASDIDPRKKHEVEERGAIWQPDLARQCDFVLVCVGFDREVAELLEQGLAPRPGGILAVLSTVHPETVQELARKASGRRLRKATNCVEPRN